jgi:hypothetical protein
VNTQIEQQDSLLNAEVNLLEQEVSNGKANLAQIKNTLSLVNQELVDTNGLARRVNDEINALEMKIVELAQQSDDQQILKLKQQLKSLMQEKKQLEQDSAKGNDARRFAGQGERQYLTGLKLGGSRTLILLDSSASMLDSSIVNIIRRRNMSDDTKKLASKWTRAINTVEWLLAKFPLQGVFQLYTFNTVVSATVSGTQNQWLAVNDATKIEQSLTQLRNTVPQGGTSLEKAFRAVSLLNPLPDNIILITDGLPTQGMDQPKSNTISGPARENLFEQAVNMLPQGIPVNILLWPMEGDPMAASAFWKLAQFSQGSFMSPSSDWP